MSEEQLTAAIEAFEHGDKRTAREILESILERDQRNTEAWYLMYQVVDDPQEKQICLENVAVLEPNNAEVQAELERLRGGAVDASFFDAEDPFAAAAEEIDAARGGDEAASFEDDQVEAPREAPAATGGALSRISSNTRLVILLIILLGVSSACMLLLAVTMLT